MATLLERAIRRTLRMSIHQALLQLSPVETRLLVLFWHLAERWGRVTPDGISVRLRMSHELLGQLVGCRRASVTTALHRINDSGLVDPQRRRDLAAARLAAGRARRRSTGSVRASARRRSSLASCPWRSSSGARSAAAGPGAETQANLERQLLDLRHGEYVDVEPERWLVWHGRGIYGPHPLRVRRATAAS